jgi:radical SAM superfamily enzyme YgiQ (UPF0313 family)
MKKKKNIVMIYPSKTDESRTTAVLYHPLALAYMARHTPDYYNIKIYDEYVGERADPKKIHADLVAFSALTPGINRAYELADKFRKKGIICVCGGPHVTALPDEALEHFDSVIMGEGEMPWRDFLKDFENKETKKKYYGPSNVPLDDLGTPRRDLVNPKYYASTIITSRGCPYNCSFCYLTVFKQRAYRLIPHATVLEDFESLRGESYVAGVDENFVGHTKEHLKDRKRLLKKMIKRRFKFHWGCQVPITIADHPDLLSLMYKAGCRAVYVGLEAVDENKEDLRKIQKHHNVGRDYKEAIREIHEHNIGVIGSAILGLDSHRPGYPKKFLKMAKESKIDAVALFFLTAWPGTPLFRQLEKEGRECRDWDWVRKDLPSIKFKNYTHEEIMKDKVEILNSFFSPFNIAKIFMRWVAKDRSILSLFIRTAIRTRRTEATLKFRIRTFQKREKKHPQAGHNRPRL